MASLNLFFTPLATTRGRVSTAATEAKSSGGSSEEPGLLDFILGALQKKDQLLETDPILQKVEEKSSGTVGRKSTVAVPPKKNGGAFGGLFAKKE
ncbi:hypothetical protein RJ639_007189 [Escallonia herrerae]|uniref:Uncharacterized protein n=1 Tax=Escallonia herrerae TaxID=1293975 RepID=A0AA89AV73_9ASTE|nr:hypothetical protein RJ639_007189 [Escallonia herrerae]